MYQVHPVRTDIAGTVESIAEITPELLYGCYNAFYNLRNMVLSVAGNVTVEQIEEVADRLLKPAAPWDLSRADAGEPAGVAAPVIEKKMAVAAPLFYFGFKHPVAGTGFVSPKESLAADALLEILAGHSSPLYTRLMKEGLINHSFGMELFDGPGYAAFLFGGESRDPEAVAAAIGDEVERLRAEGIDGDAFEAVRNAIYGNAIMSLNDVEDCGDDVMNGHFRGLAPFEELETAAALTIEDVEALLAHSLNREHTVLSIIRPL
jgi:predicted Zn-dependent peptidase